MKFDKIDINKLNFSTPFYLMSENVVRNNCKKFLNSFSKHYKKIRAYYSIKTNYELGILKTIKNTGFGAEISGGLELFLSRKVGFNPNKIIFDGPCKSKNDIRYALKEGIYIFNLDSVVDAKNLSNICKKMKKKAKVCLRINPKFKGHLTELAEIYFEKFGVPINEAKKAYDKVMDYKNLEVVGVNTHIGSQILSPKVYLKTLNGLMDLAKYIELSGCNLEEINLGGGFPSKTLIKTTFKGLALSRIGISTENIPPDINEYSNEIMKLFLNRLKELESKPYLSFEPGRYIVSNAGIFITKIRDIKNKWVFIDGSVNHIPENIFFASRRIYSIKKDKEKIKYTVSGGTLNTADILSSAVELPKTISIGDLLIIQDCGAYTISKANQFTTLRPPVYLIKSNKIKKIRREEYYEDITRLMR